MTGRRKSAHFAILPLAFILGGCAGSATRATESSHLSVRWNGARALLEPSGILAAHESLPLWHSSFVSDQGGVLERRRKLFLALFEDDTDPYTRKVNARSRCLLSNSAAELRFSSGEVPDWSNCASVPQAPIRVRRWISCRQMIWEVTYTPTGDEPTFDCQ